MPSCVAAKEITQSGQVTEERNLCKGLIDDVLVEAANDQRKAAGTDAEVTIVRRSKIGAVLTWPAKVSVATCASFCRNFRAEVEQDVSRAGAARSHCQFDTDFVQDCAF